jgi:hypothetical protein
LQKSNPLYNFGKTPLYNFGKTTGNSYAKPFIQSKNEIMANTKQPETLLDKEEEQVNVLSGEKFMPRHHCRM